MGSVEFAQKGYSIHFRHVDISNYQLHLAAPEVIQSFIAIGRSGNFIAFAGEELGKAIAGVFFVINNEDAFLLFAHKDSPVLKSAVHKSSTEIAFVKMLASAPWSFLK